MKQKLYFFNFDFPFLQAYLFLRFKTKTSLIRLPKKNPQCFYLNFNDV